MKDPDCALHHDICLIVIDRIEEDIHLKQSSGKTYVHPEGVADTLVVYPLPNEKTLKVYSEAPEILAEAFYARLAASHIFIILFAMEARRETDSAEATVNRLAYDLSTAQSQRRALGLVDTVIFGVAYTGGHARVFASRWGPRVCISRPSL